MSEYQKYEEYSKDFGGSTKPEDELSTDDKASFRNGFKQVELLPGLKLHRFCHPGKPLGAFWMDDNSFVPIIQSVQHVHLPESSRRNALRDTFALMIHWENYNRVTHRQRITLTKPWVAYVGEVGPQSAYAVRTNAPQFDIQRLGGEAEKKIAHRMGGGLQIVIPAMRKINLNKGGNLGFDLNINMLRIFKATYSKPEH